MGVKVDNGRAGMQRYGQGYIRICEQKDVENKSMCVCQESTFLSQKQTKIVLIFKEEYYMIKVMTMADDFLYQNTDSRVR